MSELLRWRRSEGYGACDDAAYQREQNAAETQGQERVSDRTAATLLQIRRNQHEHTK